MASKHPNVFICPNEGIFLIEDNKIALNVEILIEKKKELENIEKKKINRKKRRFRSRRRKSRRRKKNRRRKGGGGNQRNAERKKDLRKLAKNIVCNDKTILFSLAKSTFVIVTLYDEIYMFCNKSENHYLTLG